MHVSLLFKMCDSVCHIESEFGRNSQDGHCAFKLELVRHYVNIPCQFFFNNQENVRVKLKNDFLWFILMKVLLTCLECTHKGIQSFPF